MYIEGLWGTVKEWVDSHEIELQKLHEYYPAQPLDEMLRDILNRGLADETSIAEMVEEFDEYDA